jgi:ATP/ADP translocase
LILRGAVDVRPEERRAVLLGFGYFFALLASYYLLRPIREEMGIRGGVQALHWSFIDTVVYRGGDALAAWTYTALAGLGLAPRGLAIAGIPAAALALAVALWLARRERRMEAP